MICSVYLSGMEWRDLVQPHVMYKQVWRCAQSAHFLSLFWYPLIQSGNKTSRAQMSAPWCGVISHALWLILAKSGANNSVLMLLAHIKIQDFNEQIKQICESIMFICIYLCLCIMMVIKARKRMCMDLFYTCNSVLQLSFSNSLNSAGKMSHFREFWHTVSFKPSPASLDPPS